MDLNKPSVEKTNYFTNEKEAIYYELSQIKYLYRKVKSGDKVFWLDLDYPGFSFPFNYFLVQRGVRVYGLIHGAYFNKGDIWSDVDRRELMRGQIKLCRKVFVATNFFKNKLIKYCGKDLKNKIYNYFFPFNYKNYKPKFRKKDKIFVIGGKLTNPPHNYKIIYPNFKNREEYLNNLRECKALVSLKKAETFGYTVLEALASGCICLLPNKFSYPEFYNKIFNGFSLIWLWRNRIDLKNMLNELIWIKGSMLRKGYKNCYKLFSILKNSGRLILEEVENDV